MRKIFPVLLLIAAFWAAPAPCRACTSCHSKNPKMVRMHEALGFKDCFKCHGTGRKTTPEEQRKQMASDPLCIACHRR